MTAPRFTKGDTVEVRDTDYTQSLRIAGKTAKVVDRLGNGFYAVRTPRGTKEYKVRAPQHIG